MLQLFIHNVFPFVNSIFYRLSANMLTLLAPSHYMSVINKRFASSKRMGSADSITGSEHQNATDQRLSSADSISGSEHHNATDPLEPLCIIGSPIPHYKKLPRLFYKVMSPTATMPRDMDEKTSKMALSLMSPNASLTLYTDSARTAYLLGGLLEHNRKVYGVSIECHSHADNQACLVYVQYVRDLRELERLMVENAVRLLNMDKTDQGFILTQLSASINTWQAKNPESYYITPNSYMILLVIVHRYLGRPVIQQVTTDQERVNLELLLANLDNRLSTESIFSDVAKMITAELDGSWIGPDEAALEPVLNAQNMLVRRFDTEEYNNPTVKAIEPGLASSEEHDALLFASLTDAVADGHLKVSLSTEAK